MPESNAATNAVPVLYGIPNCDQVKKARTWLADAGHAVRFHDFRKDGLPPALLAGWVKQAGWEALLNRKGTTWRAVPEAERPTDQAGAVALMLAKPTVIKRPVLAHGKHLVVGFTPEGFAAALD